MQIIIPMSGFGERFRRAGYKTPKPLIEIDGKPVIAHVIEMFPGEQDLIFICNQDHLSEPDYHMEEIIKKYCPTARIIGINPHKLGPIHAVRQIIEILDLSQPTIVNYCDFTCYWNWFSFKKFVKDTACAGAIPAYKGFHPHTLGTTNYAYMRESNGWVDDIQEKQPYTDDRMNEFASSGTYYFATAKIMEKAFRVTMDQNINVGGEYYVSLAYKALLSANYSVAVYPLQHFMQWGTPEDVAEYKTWSDIFKSLLKVEDKCPKPNGTLIVPMAGLGQRFVDEKYTQTKPLIPISGLPMVAQASHDLPSSEQQVFVLRSDMNGHNRVANVLKDLYPKAFIKTIDHVTEGQALTALIGLDAIEQELDNIPEPITIGACDNGALYSQDAFEIMLSEKNIDVIVWGIRGYPNALRHPHMFGWVDSENGQIKNISVKTPLESPDTDPIVLGTFTFRRAEDFRLAVASLIARDGRINGEFYIDSCINDAIDLGLNCKLFEVDSYLCWGTPNDLRTFEYWQSCFHKWKGHPYELKLDARIPKDQVIKLNNKYKEGLNNFPGESL
jgi:NDP-sugar pyrophosphorylase family protein